jgi:AAA family ATP:ADP antiporter
MSEATAREPLSVRPQEIAAVAAAFLLLFCVLGGYFAVRPVRETVGTVIGRDAVRNLWGFTALFAIAIVPFYAWLVSRVRRSLLLPATYLAVAAGLVFFSFEFRSEDGIRAAGATFYVWISVLNLMLVSVFWSFLLEIFSASQSKRLFGLIAAGGTAGGLLGPIVTDLTVESVGNAGVLLIGAGMFVVAIVAQLALLGAARRIAAERDGENATRQLSEGLGGNPFEGFALVARSRYLLMIALFVVLLSAVNTFLYFEQLKQVEAAYESIEARTSVFAKFDYVVQGLTILTQLFLTGFIATRLGVTALLTIVPAVMVVGFFGLAAVGSLWALAVAMVIRRWGEYALVRPGREMLMSRLDSVSKYKAKNLIDVPVYRVSDFVFAQAQRVMEVMLSSAGAALGGAALAGGWLATGWWLGRRFDREKERETTAKP